MDPDPLLRPVGPLPAAVYWLRRGVVLVVALLLLVAVAKACGGGDDDAAREGLVAPATSEPTETPTPTWTPTWTATATPSATPTAAVGPCAPASLEVTATADRPAYKRPATPRLTLRVRNVSTAPCRQDLGAANQELRVLSGQDRIWSSDDCSPRGNPELVTLQPGEIQQSTVAWNLRRSRPGCPEGQPGAQPGTYRVIGRVGDVTSEGAAFRLE